MTIANAKPDLLITGPIGTTTVNAASSAWHDYLTVEAKITAAIAYAVSIGAKYCYVPDSFLPYTASLVTFNTAVRMIAEGYNPTTWHVAAYGAFGNSATNDQPAIQAAINGAQVGGVGSTVDFGAAGYALTSGLTITKQIRLRGQAGWDGTILLFNTGSGNTAITWNNASNIVRTGFGMEGLCLRGQGPTDGQTAVALTNCAGMAFLDITFGHDTNGFQTVFKNTFTNSWNLFFDHCFWANNGNAFDNTLSSNSGEQLLFHHCTFGGSATAANTLTLADNNADVHFNMCALDSSAVTISAGRVSFTNMHWEDPNSGLLTTQFVTISGGQVTMLGGVMLLNALATATRLITLSGGLLAIFGTYMQGATAGTAAAIALSGGGRVFWQGFLTQTGTTPLFQITAPFSGSSTFPATLESPDMVGGDRGDASVTLVAGVDFQTQRFNTPLTVDRTVTFNTVNAWQGAKFRIVRDTGATGSASLIVLTKSLAVGQWAEVMYTGSTWVVTQSQNAQSNLGTFALTDASTVTVDAARGTFMRVAPSASPRTIANPTNGIAGSLLGFDIFNNTGGALVTTWSANYHLAGAWVDPATGKGRTILFYSLDGTTYREVGRGAADYT